MLVMEEQPMETIPKGEIVKEVIQRQCMGEEVLHAEVTVWGTILSEGTPLEER
jgi:hypothetical protein